MAPVNGARGAWSAEAAHAANEELLGVIELARPLGDLAKLNAVNDFYNQKVEYADDQEVWGERDHWTTPKTLLANGRGDCEDYAIAKYFALLQAGIAQDQLRILYVRVQVRGQAPQAHMVLGYFPARGMLARAKAALGVGKEERVSTDPLILDNLRDRKSEKLDGRAPIAPLSERQELTPVFSFDQEHVFEGVGDTSAGDSRARLAQWAAVLRDRARED